MVKGRSTNRHPDLREYEPNGLWKMLHSRNVGLLAVLSVILLVACLPGAYTSPLEFSIRNSDHNNGSTQKIGEGKLGAIATENAICSRHGIEMLEMGGNAADAVSTHCWRWRRSGGSVED